MFDRKFKIQKDHHPLTWLNPFKESNIKLQIWKFQLNDFDTEYTKGKTNVEQIILVA